MKCSEIERYFSEYIDGQAAPEIMAAIDAHVAECEDCAIALADYRRFAQAFSRLEEEDLPFGFNLRLQERLAEESRRPRVKPLTSRSWFKGLAVCAGLVVCVGVFALGASVFGGSLFRAGSAAPAEEEIYRYNLQEEMGYSTAQYDMEMGGAPAEAPKAYADEDAGMYNAAPRLTGAGDNGAAAAMERKIIRNWNLSLEVTDFDLAFSTLEDIAARYGGYVVNAQKYDSQGAVTRNGWISLRVEAERLNAALTEIEALGKVENSNYYTSDVTAEYYDIQSRLEQYQAQEARLTELYAAASGIEDLISIETKLVEVQMQIDSLEGTVRYYDQLTALSLIEINIYTPSVYTQSVEPQGWSGFWLQIQKGFLSGLNRLLDFFADLVILLVRMLPALVVLAVLAVTVLLIVRRRRRKRQSRQE